MIHKNSGLRFAIVDVEATGFSRNDRILEIAVVHADPDGTVTGRWSTLLNPGRHIPNSDIHGITAGDITGAPRFADIAAELAEQLTGRIFVAHNVPFDSRMIAAEFSRIGVSGHPFDGASLCTLSLTGQLLPTAGRGLSTALAAVGITNSHAHAALGDAEATADLLHHFLTCFPNDLAIDLAYLSPVELPVADIAALSGGARAALHNRTDATQTNDGTWLNRVASGLPIVGEDDADAYLDLLTTAMLDRQLSVHEIDALTACAADLGLGREQVRDLHTSFLRQLAVLAWADGIVTPEERDELYFIAGALDVPASEVSRLLEAPATEGDAVPVSGLHLAPGDRVTFTGETEIPRTVWESRATAAGLDVGGVTKKSVLLVAADPDSFSRKAEKARNLGVPVVSETGFARLLGELENPSEQPSPRPEPKPSPEPSPQTARRKEPRRMSSTSLFNQVDLEIGNLTISLYYMGVTNHALAHNRIPVVRFIEFALDDSATEPSPAGELTISAVVDGEPLFSSGVIPVPSLEPGTGSHTEPHDATRVAVAKTLESTEARTGDMTVLVTVGDHTVEQSVDLDVLAPDEWFNSPLYYQSLAAWVQPNSPAVTPVLATVSDLLREHTGDGSVSGNQGGPERTIEIAGAVFEALRSMDIRYINPPASFEYTGQRVRTSGRVLTDRLGTCIDLSLAYAAVAEQCGLLPVVIMLPGHAMTGVLLSDDPLPSPTITEPTVINNYIRSGRLMPIDAVFYDSSVSFRSVVERTRAQLKDTSINGLIDIHAAHRDGMKPFSDGTAGSPVAAVFPTEEDAPTTADSWVMPDTGTASVEDGSGSFRDINDPAPFRVQKWKRELLDLSLRNRLLNMRSGPEVLDFRLAPGSLAELDDQIHAGQKIAVHPIDDVSDNRRLQGIHRVTDLPSEQVAAELTDRHRIYADLTDARYASWFQKLNRSVRTYTEETGSSNLYLTLGAMIHENTAGKPALAPLFLIPVKIVGGRGNARFQIQVDTTTEATPNHCLVEWLHQVHNVTIDALARPKLDASGLDIAHAMSAISAALIEAELPYTVVEYSRLIIAKFSTYGIWKDLRDNWETFMEAPVFRHLATKAGAAFTDPVSLTTGVSAKDVVAREDELALPVSADGAQLQAVTAAAEGYSFVLEGPPGTGKSQTITNLIAHCMAQGKKVLFVAEKQAALDVVRDRLSRVGLAPFTLDLHGTEQKPAAIRQQLKESVDAEVHYDMHLWDNAVANLRSRLAPLAEYPGQIHDRNGAGHSLWTAVSALTSMDDGPVAPVPEKVVAAPTMPVDAMQSQVSRLSTQAQVTDFPSIPRWSLVGPNPKSEKIVLSAHSRLEETRAVLEAVPEIKVLLEDGDVPALVEQLRSVEAIPEDSRLTPDDCARLAHSEERLKSLAAEVDRLKGDFADVSAMFSASFIRSGDPAPVLEALEATKKGMFGKKKKLDAYRSALAVAVPPSVTAIDVETVYAPERVEPQLLRLPQLRAVAGDIAQKIAAIPGAESLAGRSPADPNLPANLWQCGDDLGKAIKDSSRAPELLQLTTRMQSQGLDAPLSDTLSDIEDAWVSWCSALDATAESVAHWVTTRGAATRVEAWLSCAEEWNDDLKATGDLLITRAVQWEYMARPLRGAGLAAFVAQVEEGQIEPRDLDMALRRGLAEASVSERSQRFNLRSFHRTLRESELKELSTAITKVQQEATRALPARLLAQRPFTQGRLDGRAALLRRQLDAKRNAKSFRTLLGEFGEEILSVAPCFFVSPASLATFVDPKAVTFDLVIFDEASQVTVDQAMGALGRARAAVIVGDSKQMPPTRIGKTTLGNSDDLPEETADGEAADAMSALDDLESILSEAVESGLPQLWLSWHYRSQDESLIAFSNERYYEGHLSSLPSPGGVPGAGVSLVRVDGQFIRKADVKAGLGTLGTNPVEAQAIVDSVVRRVNDPLTKDESIGVVTFNVPQRDHILDLLEECGDPLVARRLVPGPEGIFVKNLENVQGDERDVILFSTAFSKQSDGRPMPMNFGPLSRKGGERRLNVAVTRARKEVELFCSFAPTEIDLNRTTSAGLRDLRGYLEAAIEHASPVAARRGVAVNTNTLRDDLAVALRQRGWVVETDYGLSSYTLDLVVRPADDERWHAAVLTDSDRWAGMDTVADRDLTPGLLGKLMHWAGTVRVWLPEWIEDRDAVIDRVEAEIRAAGEKIAEQDAARAKVLEEAERALAEERERIAAEEKAEEEAREQALTELGEGADPSAADDGDVDAAEIEDIVDDLLGRSSDEELEEAPVQWSDEEAAAETAVDSVPAPSNPFEAPAMAGRANPFAQPAENNTVNHHEADDEAAVEPAEPSVPVRSVSTATPSAVPATPTPSTGRHSREEETATSRMGTGAGPLPTELPYVPLQDKAALGEREELEAGFSTTRIAELREDVAVMIADSGPVRLGRLRTAIAKRFGRQKTSKLINVTIDKLIPQELVHEESADTSFVWLSAEGPEAWNHVRRSEGRNLPDISLREISCAARLVLNRSPELAELTPESREKLHRAVLGTFNIGRLTGQAKDRINQALDLL
ncbi:DUF4011 domain-containing protein [Candidatus Corynebacterium faecigallinarum]|uniref:DUF4011 domain-containing protein n=1 Tax=Candidatus Corynebacterium faecigallinarum TaxID=2838528 RepID=UPI003FD6B33F